MSRLPFHQPLRAGLAALAPLLAALATVPCASAESAPMEFNVKAFGAAGDGKTIDTAAINRAIDAAAAQGGGTVRFPAGTYASYSIHLRSNIALYLDAGAEILAAEPAADLSVGYDPPEPNPGTDRYQDFGHSHWHNSLIWGVDLHDISILGPGKIYGYGLSRGSNRTVRDVTPEERMAGAEAPAAELRELRDLEPDTPTPDRPFGFPNSHDSLPAGMGDKEIALKNCHNVSIRDVTLYHGGHFGILASGVDNLIISGLKIDTNRDGMDIDSCKNVIVSDCLVNSPFDDGICPKADYGLGYNRVCENVTITNCQVSGFNEGTLLSATYGRNDPNYGANPAWPPSGPNGRIKLGTEGNGGFKNFTISNCTFVYCRGIALEEVDGGWLEDIAITNITMRDVPNAGIYIRLGARNRGPAGTNNGVLRRVIISNVVASNVDSRWGSIISGDPGCEIEDLTLSNIRILYRGGGTAEQAAIDPPEVPANGPASYPEPNRHGPTMPAYGFFIRHVRGIQMHDIYLSTMAPDARPPFVLEDVQDADFDHVKAPHPNGVSTFVLRNVKDLGVLNCDGVPDTRHDESGPEQKL